MSVVYKLKFKLYKTPNFDKILLFQDEFMQRYQILNHFRAANIDYFVLCLYTVVSKL